MQTSNLNSFDLRIGNLLLYENRVIEVVGLNKGWIEYYNEEFDKCGDKPKYFHPIELTEEILFKMGLDKVINIQTWNGGVFIWHNGIIEYQCGDCNYDAIICQCKYLHELQNAYFILTGQELEVKL